MILYSLNKVLRYGNPAHKSYNGPRDTNQNNNSLTDTPLIPLISVFNLPSLPFLTPREGDLLTLLLLVKVPPKAYKSYKFSLFKIMSHDFYETVFYIFYCQFHSLLGIFGKVFLGGYLN